MEPTDSLFTGDNAAFLDERYAAWLRDPASVDARWRALFESFAVPSNGHGHLAGETPVFPRRSIFAAAGAPGLAELQDLGAEVASLMYAWRQHGHRWAEIDPLAPREKPPVPELDPAHHGLEPSDFDREVANPGIVGLPATTTPRAMIDYLNRAWCGSIGAEIADIRSYEERSWVSSQIERLPVSPVLDRPGAARLMGQLSDAENFERTLQSRFPGAKRFSIEGGESLVPLLQEIVRRSALQGARDFVLGMAHRGRLSTLVNVLNKPASMIVAEFQDVHGQAHGSGDVKYHLGFSSDTTTADGVPVHLTLAPNPSHLEAVDPVVEGRARAKQDRIGADGKERVVPILVHGDAAFAGQGVVAEVLNLSELHGYRTGGTIHIVVNNQIGFTTPPADSRSTPYSTDVARMLGIPIFHVNGEDPFALVAVAAIAVDWRMRCQRDVVIDLYCYRKHGHNEADEPAFTQPRMYERIRTRKSPRENVGAALVRSGLLTQAEVDQIQAESAEKMTSAAASTGSEPRWASSLPAVHEDGVAVLRELWSQYTGGDSREEIDTSWRIERLRDLLIRLNTLPPEGKWHPKVKRVFDARLESARGEKPLDWGTAEHAAFATILADGTGIRLSGEDSCRGTFTQRHAVVTDVETEAEYTPLAQFGRFEGYDSALSEYGVLGFELGYALDAPDVLVMWEAQFGDFANGAQVIIDQYLASSQQKWGRLNGLVLLLPHGYEGQGPEHSSARPERFLSACAEDNLQVAYPSTPANYYHLLRRQALRDVRKPLVILTPKALLRHPDAVSPLEELATGRFRAVIPDPTPPETVTRIVFCTGKVFYDLDAKRRATPGSTVTIHRVELLYPFPAEEIAHLLEAAPMAEVAWCQEEPRNMGAWPSLLHWWAEVLPPDSVPGYVGRPAAASPATGSYKKHTAEQARLVDDALGTQVPET